MRTTARYIAVSALMGFGATSQAQTPQGTVGAHELEEVIVTATKREQSAQDVAISLLVASGEEIERSGLRDLEGLGSQLPNVNLARTGISDLLIIRGVGSGINLGFEQSTATFVDGIYHGRSRMARGALFDLERVEVLRGPQSTYFGNNAIAGAFNIVTSKPGRVFEANMLASYEFEQRESVIEAGLGGPLSDAWRIRLAGRWADMDGWLENLATGGMEPDRRDAAGRLTVVWEPSEVFAATLKGEIHDTRIDSGAIPNQLIYCPADPAFGASALAPFRPCNRYQALPNFEARFDDRRAVERDGGSMRGHEFVLALDWQLPVGTLSSVTGYTGFDFEQDTDSDGTPLRVLQIGYDEKMKQTSQELRLTSSAGGRLEYLLGAYWQKDSLQSGAVLGQHVREALPFIFGPLGEMGQALLAASLPTLPWGQETYLDQDSRTRALFGSVTVRMSDQWSAIAGVRWSETRKNALQRAGLYSIDGVNDPYGHERGEPLTGLALAAASGVTGTVPHTFIGSRKDDDLLPSLTLQYVPRRDLMFYASFGQGFKAGGFDGTVFTNDRSAWQFDPETVDAYEVGMKSLWREAGITLNLAAFRSVYEDLQLAVPVSVGTAVAVVTRNVAGLRSQGLELDAAWAPNSNWRVGLSAAWLDASYENFGNGPCTVLQGLRTPPGQACFQNLSGQAPPYAPRYSGRLSVGTRYPLGSTGLRWSSELSYSFTDEFDVLTSNEPYVRSPAYEKLDVRLGVGDPGGRWELAALIRNVADERTWSWGQQLGLGAGHFQVIPDAPRTVALQGRYRW